MDQKDRILETTYRMFTSIGYSGVTMDQIAHNCGVGKETLYKYFSSKEALLLSCIDRFAEKVGLEVESIITDQKLSPQQKITEFIVPVLRFVSGMNSSTLNDIQQNVPEAYEKILETRKKIILLNIIHVVNEGKERGIFRENLNSLLVAHIFIGAVSHLSVPQVREEIGLPLGQLLNLVLSIMWEGCLRETRQNNAV